MIDKRQRVVKGMERRRRAGEGVSGEVDLLFYTQCIHASLSKWCTG
jgi:hypothetical protein